MKTNLHTKFSEFLNENFDDLSRYTLDDNYYLYKDGLREYCSTSKSDLIDFLKRRKPELIEYFGLKTPPQKILKPNKGKRFFPTLNPMKLSKSDMIKLGATGSLTHAYERYIPVDKIDGLDPEPGGWVDKDGYERDFVPNTNIDSSIEVMYDKDNDIYMLQNGNHRIKQAKVNGDKYIRAFIQPDRGEIGKLAKLKI